MPRKTRVLHGDDEYLFVEAPGDPQGPALQVFAKPANARAVPPGRSPTHQTEHGQWLQVARFDGVALTVDPDAPAPLAATLQGLLPRYAEMREQHIARAKHPCHWIHAEGRPLHGLHPAQPAGLLFKLWSSAERAAAVVRELGVEARVFSTGDLREFLELRAEEGYAGALLDDEELIFFCLDAAGRMQFLRIAAAAGGEDADEAAAEAGDRAAPATVASHHLATHLLAENGRFEPYEGDEALEPFVDQDGWDRLLVRTFGLLPFHGHAAGWRCFMLVRDGQPVARRGDDPTERQAQLPLFHDPAAADEWRSRHRQGKAAIERVTDLKATVAAAQARGELVQLQPDDHRVRGGTLWMGRDGALHLLGYSGIWRSTDGDAFTRVDEDDTDAAADAQSSGTT
ncbi:MAG: hypothetical protein FJ293_05410 [Planctomycetes bacterium]|nr:hypothetical protein [Planctomycetota bacterium]